MTLRPMVKEKYTNPMRAASPSKKSPFGDPLVMRSRIPNTVDWLSDRKGRKGLYYQETITRGNKERKARGNFHTRPWNIDKSDLSSVHPFRDELESTLTSRPSVINCSRRDATEPIVWYHTDTWVTKYANAPPG
jgi:hypothetical protein